MSSQNVEFFREESGSRLTESINDYLQIEPNKFIDKIDFRVTTTAGMNTFYALVVFGDAP